MIKLQAIPGKEVEKYDWPGTLEEAVDMLIELPDDELPLLERMDESTLELLHVSLGPYIRNRFGLWRGNQNLLDDCGTDHADEAYAVILDNMMKRLRSQ